MAITVNKQQTRAASSSSVNPSEKPQQPFALMSLPQELRDCIYGELLEPEKLRNPRDKVPSYKLQPAILRASRQTYAEASKILYGKNQWGLAVFQSADIVKALLGAEWCPIPELCHVITRNVDSFCVLAALELRIRGSMEETEVKVLVARCDWHRFFQSIVHLVSRISARYYLNPRAQPSYDFDLQFSNFYPEKDKNLLESIQYIHRIQNVCIHGSILQSTAQKLATSMKTQITNHQQILQRANEYQTRGDLQLASSGFSDAVEIYSHGLEYLRALMGTAVTFQGDNINMLELRYKTLSMWFARALCNIQLGHSTRVKGNELFLYILQRGPENVYQTPFYEGVVLKDQEKGWDAMRTVVTALKQRPARMRVNKDIDYMEALLDRMIEATPSGVVQKAGIIVDMPYI